MIGPVSLLEALIESMLDITASLVNLLIIKYSLQPADKEHTFGHGKAESLHYQSDLYINVVINIALGLSWFGLMQADSVFAILIGLYILYSAFIMLQEATQTLLDRNLPDEELEAIKSCCMAVEGVLGAII